MYTFSIFITAALLQTGISLNSEDTDLNPLSSNYDVVDENAENFETGIVKIEKLTVSIVTEICKDADKLIYIRQDDVVVSCRDFFNEQAEDDFIRIRRSAGELDGSGDDMDKPETTIQEQTNQTEEETTTEKIKLEETIPKETIPEINTSEETTPKEITPEETTPKEITPEETTPKKTTPEETTPKETTPEETTPEETTLKVTTDTVNLAPEVKIPEITSEDEQINTTTEKAEKNEDEAHTSPIPDISAEESTKRTEEINTDESKQPLSPDLHENKKEPSEETSQNSDKDPNKDVEIRKEKGGRTLINTPPKEDTKVMNHEGNDEPVETKESTEPKQAASKDTTILICLFVAVVVVGLMAFGYNFIKKRRQQSADLERVERNSVKRSLQNLAKPEGGEAEKKPLIGDSKEVEMVDMKKQSEEQKENGTSEPVVKS